MKDIPTLNPRRPYDEEDEIAEQPKLACYYESDADYFINNRELILYLLAPLEAQQEAKP